MLKSIIARIKSQKSSTVNQQKQQNCKQSQLPQNINVNYSQEPRSERQSYPQTQFQQQSLQSFSSLDSQLNQLQCGIKTIRYCYVNNIPDIFVKVMACPISHFNLLPHSKRKVKQIDLNKHQFPAYLNFMKPLLQKLLPTYNHILINHYPKGIGIMHHFDGPLYKDRVVVLSLGGPVVISFVQDYSKRIKGTNILLQDRSIHIFELDAYNKYLHGIEDRKYDSIIFKIKVLGSKQSLQNQTSNQNEQNRNKLQNLSDDKNCLRIIQQQNCYQLTQSSIFNIDNCPTVIGLIRKYVKKLTFIQGQQSINQRITSQIQKIEIQRQKYCIQFIEQGDKFVFRGCFIFIKDQKPNQIFTGNQQLKEKCWNEFKWKLQIQRQQRISITIRQKYIQTNK